MSKILSFQHIINIELSTDTLHSFFSIVHCIYTSQFRLVTFQGWVAFYALQR